MKNICIAHISGMSCLSCAAAVKKALQLQPSVKDAQVNLADHTAYIEFYYSDTCSKKKITEALKKVGYPIYWITEKKNFQNVDIYYKEYKSLKNRAIWSMFFGTPILIIAMFLPEIPIFRWLMMFLSFLVLTVWGNIFFKRAWKSLRYRYWGMDLLIVLSTSIAFLYSAFNTFFPRFVKFYSLDSHVYFETAAMIICFLLIGKTIEYRVRIKSSKAIHKLIDLQPDFAHILLENGQVNQIPINKVYPGACLRIKPGEKIPVDGHLQKGHSYINEHMISGESLPVFKTIGDKVFAGTLNQGGSFDIKTEKTGVDTFLFSIICAIKRAQFSKVPIEKITNRIAKFFVPLVIFIAFVALFSWGFSDFENSWAIGIHSLLNVLIIACPCALGLAIPTALMAGVGRAAQEGVLIKDVESIEHACKIDHLIFDKTGTLTIGKPILKESFWLEKSKYTISVLYALESHSEHPLANAFLSYYKDDLTKIKLSIEDFKNHPGKGVEAICDGKKYCIGSISWLVEQDVFFDPKSKMYLSNFKDKAYTLLGFSEGDKLLAIFGLTDTLRPESKEIVEKLRAMGMKLHILTGDRIETAKILADQLRIYSVKGSQIPSDKMDFIKNLQKKGESIAMVGDGINDAPALAQANLSIAMGEGSGIAIETAKITILGSDLRKIPFAIDISRRTWYTIRQNLFFAFIYNGLSISLAAGLWYPFTKFFLSPIIASIAMVLSSISLIINSLRLKNT